MSDIDTSTESEDTPLAWPSAADVVPDDQVTTEPEPEGADEETPTPEPTQEETPAPAPEPEAEATEQPTGLAALPESWQDTIKDLRQENATYRVRAAEYEQVFGEYDDAARAKFLDLAAGMADESRHQEVATEFIDIGRRILSHYGVEVPELPARDPNAPMTRAEYEAAEREREQQRQIDQDMQALAKQVTDLGYELGSLDHYALLRAAQEDMVDGQPIPLEKAHEKVQAWKKSMIDGFIAEHQKKVSAHLPTPPQTGSAPAEMPDELPEDQADALKLARQQFNAMLDAS